MCPFQSLGVGPLGAVPKVPKIQGVRSDLNRGKHLIEHESEQNTAVSAPAGDSWGRRHNDVVGQRRR